MLSTANMKSSQYIPMHSKQIRGLAFSTQSKNLLLSASLDCTVKLTRWVRQESHSTGPVSVLNAFLLGVVIMTTQEAERKVTN